MPVDVREPVERRYDRRQALRLGGASLVALYLAGCGGGGGSGSGSKPVAVTFDMEYVGKPGSMKAYWSALKARLDKADAGVTISELTFVPFSNLESALQNAHAAKSGSTIETWYPDFSTYQFSSQGSITPVENYVSADSTKDWILLSKIGGKWWSAPYIVEGTVLVGNRQHFGKAGLDVKERFPSWEAFVTACGKLKNQGVTPCMIGASDGFAAQSWLQAATMDVTDSVKDLVEFVLGKKSVDEPSIGVWASRLNELHAKGYINPDATQISHQQSLGRFMKGEGAMLMDSSGAIYNSTNSNQFAVLSYWNGPGKLAAPAVAASDTLQITSYGANKEAAGKLITYMLEPDQLKLFHDTTGVFLGSRAFDAAGLDPLPRAAWDLITQGEPTPWWPANYVTQTTIGSQFDIAPKAVAGEDPAKVLKEYNQRQVEWRTQNQAQASLVEKYLGTLKDAPDFG
jgi:ABC-type glycerol-3-phosphate transport system substrate-binding protein